MSTLVTPSAKSHERVTGRWVRDLQVGTRRDWFIYYAKLAVGTPVPWLISAFVCLTFLSRAGLELAAWSCAALTFVYIMVDRFSRTKEFRFFRVGSDFFLLGFCIVGAVGAFYDISTAHSLATLSGIRWVLLLYAIAYTWELFPGLNRVFFLMIGAASVAAGYGVWQHFVGLDLIRQTALANAPVSGYPYFIASGFFGTPEIFGTLLATLLPLPAAAFLLQDERDQSWKNWIPVALVVLLSIAILWTYRPGLWMAAIGGLLVTMLMKGRRTFTFASIVAGAITLTVFATYSSPGEMLDNVIKSEESRAAIQRAQINTQVSLWQQNTWIGVGHRAMEETNYDPGTGNVYFQILAQTGVLGAAFYLLFVLGFMLLTYRIFQEIPSTHYWHRVLVSGGLGSQIAFHVAGLYWSTVAEALAMNFFILIIASLSYLTEHYERGIVSDDFSL